MSAADLYGVRSGGDARQNASVAITLLPGCQLFKMFVGARPVSTGEYGKTGLLGRFIMKAIFWKREADILQVSRLEDDLPSFAE